MKKFRYTGLTLVELLVVIFIIATVTASVIPVMLPVVESRRIREAARGANTFFSGARDRALEKQRVSGVEIRRLANENGAALHLQYVQSPAPYSGEFTNSAFTVSLYPANQGNPANYGVRASWTGGLVNANLIRAGDQVQLAYHSDIYEVVTVGSSYLDLRIRNSGRRLPWPDHPSGTANVPFRIVRTPTRSSSATYDFPEGTAIDLVGSGIGAGQFTLDADPVVILFSPSGGVESVWVGGTKIRPLSSIHLLIGRREKVPAPSSGGTRENTNWLDPDNLWVSIGHQTGQVSTTEMAPVTQAQISANETFLAARRFARDRLKMGGQ